jgi:hypothetical protein
MSALWPNRCTGTTRRDGRANRTCVDVERRAIDVDEHGTRAEPRDGAGGREKRKRGRHHFVSRPDIERHQRCEKRIGPRRHTDRVRDLEERRKLALEALNLRAEDELLRVADARDGLEYAAAQRRELCFEVDQRDFAGRHEH